jgi:hypothetical protein
MLSNNLAGLLGPYKRLTSKHALSPTYRALELAPGLVRGCSPAAILETRMEHGLKEAVFVDAATFLAIIDSLPGGKEVELSREEASLAWSCGAARGRIALLNIADMPRIPDSKPAGGWKPSGEFVKAMRLGGMSCDNQALLSMGLYGIVIDRENGLVYSSDNVTISIADFDPKGMDDATPPQMTFTPEVIDLLAGVIMAGKGEAWSDRGGLHYEDEFCSLFVKEVPPLKNSALEMFSRFMDDDIKAKLSPDAIAAFIKRAGAMAESRRQTSISLGAREGKLELIFNEGTAQSDELFLIEEKVPDMQPVSLDGGKLARALGHITTAVLDHMARQVLVLTGPGFTYLLGGRK